MITGTSSGIGTQFARVLHAAGAQLVMAARRLDRLEALATELPGSVPIACDVSVDSQCEALVDSALARFGQIDVLINNAGTVSTHRPEEEPMVEWRRVMAINIDAAFHLSQLVARKDMLVRRSGNIINVASVLGLVSSGATQPGELRRIEGRAGEHLSGAGVPLGSEEHSGQCSLPGVLRLRTHPRIDRG